MELKSTVESARPDIHDLLMIAARVLERHVVGDAKPHGVAAGR